MAEVLVVALFGGLGAALRGWLGNFKGFLPWGILIANTVATAIAMWGLVWAPQLQLILVAGIAGGLSTFSTFVGQTWQLMRDRRRPAALLNVILNILLPSTAAYLAILWH